MGIPVTVYHGKRLLHDAELQSVSPYCPWCGCEKRQQIATLQQEPLVTLLECSECFATSVSKMPTGVALANYYAAYYAREKSDKATPKVTCGDVRRMGTHLARLMKNCRKKHMLRILDFGGGDGSVAVQVAEVFMQTINVTERIEITVVDYNAVLTAPTNPAICLQHCSALVDLQGSAFDFVIASAVLEHMPEAKITLDQLLDLMSPGAVFYARTPFIVPLLKFCMRFGVKLDFTFPGHLYDLGQSFWEREFALPCRKTSFRILSSRPSVVETSLETHMLRTLVSYACKLPWYLFGRRWRFVGGWEIAVERIR